MGMEVGTAMVLSSIIGAGSAVYQSEKQENIAEREARRLAEAEEARRVEAERIARDTRPEGEGLEAIQFGVDGDDELGSVSEFLVPKPKPALGMQSKGGTLGFAV